MIYAVAAIDDPAREERDSPREFHGRSPAIGDVNELFANHAHARRAVAAWRRRASNDQ